MEAFREAFTGPFAVGCRRQSVGERERIGSVGRVLDQSCQSPQRRTTCGNEPDKLVVDLEPLEAELVSVSVGELECFGPLCHLEQSVDHLPGILGKPDLGLDPDDPVIQFERFGRGSIPIVVGQVAEDGAKGPGLGGEFVLAASGRGGYRLPFGLDQRRATRILNGRLADGFDGPSGSSARLVGSRR